MYPAYRTFIGLLFLYTSYLIQIIHGHGIGLKNPLLKKLISNSQPDLIHLSFGNTVTDIVIVWSTTKNVKMHIEFARTVESFQKVESEKVVLESHSNHAAKFLHRAVLSDLNHGESYFYRIVGDSGANSNIFKFKIPTNLPKRRHSFIVIADMGLNSKHLEFLTYEMRNKDYESVFHVGDIAYNLHIDGGHYGDEFLKHTEKFAASIPYMTVPGDHERFHEFYHYR